MGSTSLMAMIPVDRPTAKRMDWVMPFPALLARLQELTRGRVLELEQGLPAARPESTSESEWNAFLDQCHITDEWIDLHVKF